MVAVLILVLLGVLLWVLSASQSNTTSAASNIPLNFGDLGSMNAGSAVSGNSFADQMAQAIYQFEGGGKPGAANSHNNNPGNIGGGSNTFPTWQAGWDALVNQINTDATNNPSWNFNNFFAHYLGSNPSDLKTTAQGDPVSYANFVAGQLGVSPTDTVSGYLSGNYVTGS